MMDNSVIGPDPGGGVLTPKQALRYFEFFKPGTRREVLLLGDLVEQLVHYVRSKNHKVLCGSRVGGCALCLKAGESDDVSDQQVEYYAAAFVRVWSEREFKQKVVVFTAASGEQVLRLVPEGSLRGHRFEVARQSSQRFKIAPLAGPPSGLAHVIPVAFDLVPFVRARFGRPQDPGQPLVFLPPIPSRELVSGPVGRPKPLNLSAEDCAPLPEETKTKLREYVSKLYGQPADQPSATEAEVGELQVIENADRPELYAPRHYVGNGTVPTRDDQSCGAAILGAVLDKLPPGHPARNGKPTTPPKNGGA